MTNINMNALYKSFRENILSYLHLLEGSFAEVNEFVKTLINLDPFILDVRESTPTQKALNLTVVVSYTRCFTNNYGFYNAKEVNENLISNFIDDEVKLHKKLKKLRNQEFVHSDASSLDIHIYDDGDFTHSWRVVRENLEIQELQLLLNMIDKIRNQIDKEIEHIE